MIDDATADRADDPPTESHETIMEATYRALCAEGYADLTMQDIADEADRSTSLLHYHYDTKEQLLVSFLSFLLDRFDEKLDRMAADTPAERLRGLVEKLLPEAGDEEWDRFHRALLELRTQAPYSDAYREALARNKTFIQAQLADIVAAGIEAGQFREVDPEETARFLLASLDGARSSRVTLDDGADAPAVRAGLARFVRADLLTDEVDPAEVGWGREETDGMVPELEATEDAR